MTSNNFTLVPAGVFTSFPQLTTLFENLALLSDLIVAFTLISTIFVLLSTMKLYSFQCRFRYIYSNPVSSIASNAFPNNLTMFLFVRLPSDYVAGTDQNMQLRSRIVGHQLFKCVLSCVVLLMFNKLFYVDTFNQCVNLCGNGSICTTAPGEYWQGASTTFASCSCQPGYVSLAGGVSASNPCLTCLLKLWGPRKLPFSREVTYLCDIAF